jgi:hypothetical protein
VNFTYNGSATVPTAAGSYVVVATINNISYQGTATGTLVIGKAAATVTLGNLAQAYTGSPLPAAATTSPAGLPVNLTYNGSATVPTAVGSYAVVATINDTNDQGTATGTLVIGKAAATVTLGNLAPAYTGSSLSATATTSPAGLPVNLTYNGSATVPTVAGSYAVVATINDTNYQGTATGNLTIRQQKPSMQWAMPAPITYGTALTAAQLDATSSVAGSFTFNPSAGNRARRRSEPDALGDVYAGEYRKFLLRDADCADRGQSGCGGGQHIFQCQSIVLAKRCELYRHGELDGGHANGIRDVSGWQNAAWHEHTLDGRGNIHHRVPVDRDSFDHRCLQRRCQLHWHRERHAGAECDRLRRQFGSRRRNQWG